MEAETRQRPSGPVTDTTAGAYPLLMVHRYDKTGSVRKTEESTSIASINDIVAFVNAQPELTNSLETQMASLTTHVESVRSRTDQVQGRLLGL